MANGRQLDYIIRLVPELKEFDALKDKLKKIDMGEMLTFSPEEAKKLKGILNAQIKDIGKTAKETGTKIGKDLAAGISKAQIQKSLDIDVGKLKDAMAVVEKLTGLLSDSSGSDSWLKNGKQLIESIKNSEQSLKTFEASMQKLDDKFEGINTQIASTIQNFDLLQQKFDAFAKGGQRTTVSPFEGVSKQIDEEVDKIQKALDKVSDINKKTSIKTTSNSKKSDVEKEIELISQSIEDAEDKIASLSQKLKTPNLGLEEERKASIDLAKSYVDQATQFKKLMQIKKKAGVYATSAMSKEGIEDNLVDRFTDAQRNARNIINKLSTPSKSSDTGLGLSFSLPSIDDIRSKVNGVIDELNKSNSLHKIKLSIDDSANVIKDKEKRAYKDNPASEDAEADELVNKTEQRFDRILNVIKSKQDKIESNTNEWRKRMIAAMKIASSDLEFEFGWDKKLEAGANDLFNALQDYFYQPENKLDLIVDVESLSRQIKTVLANGGFSVAPSGGGAPIDETTIANIMKSVLYGTPMTVASNSSSLVDSHSEDLDIDDDIDDAAESSAEYVKALDETTISIGHVIEALRKFADISTKANASASSKKVAEWLGLHNIDVSTIGNATDSQIAEMLKNALMTKDGTGRAVGRDMPTELLGLINKYKMNPETGAGKSVKHLSQTLGELFSITEVETELSEIISKRRERISVFKDVEGSGFEHIGRVLGTLNNVRSTKSYTRTPSLDKIDDASRYFESKIEKNPELKVIADELVKLRGARDKLGDNTSEEAKREFDIAAKEFYNNTKSIYDKFSEQWLGFKGDVWVEGRGKQAIRNPNDVLKIPENAVIVDVRVDPATAAYVKTGVYNDEGGKYDYRADKRSQRRNSRGTKYDFTREQEYEKDILNREISYEEFKPLEKSELPAGTSLESLKKSAKQISELTKQVNEGRTFVENLNETKKRIESEISQMQVGDIENLPKVNVGKFERLSKLGSDLGKVITNATSALKNNSELDLGKIDNLDKETENSLSLLQSIIRHNYERSTELEKINAEISKIKEGKGLSREELNRRRNAETQAGNSKEADFYKDLLYNQSSIDQRLSNLQEQKKKIDEDNVKSQNKAREILNQLSQTRESNITRTGEEAQAVATKLREIRQTLYDQAAQYVSILNNKNTDESTRNIALGKLQGTLKSLNSAQNSFAGIQAYVPELSFFDDSNQSDTFNQWIENYTRDRVNAVKKELDTLLNKKGRGRKPQKRIAELEAYIAKWDNIAPENILSANESLLANVNKEIGNKNLEISKNETALKLAEESKAILATYSRDTKFLKEYNKFLEKEKKLLEQVNNLKKKGADKADIDKKEKELKNIRAEMNSFLAENKTGERTQYGRQLAKEYQANLYTAKRQQRIAGIRIADIEDQESQIGQYRLGVGIGLSTLNKTKNNLISQYMNGSYVRELESAKRELEKRITSLMTSKGLDASDSKQVEEFLHSKTGQSVVEDLSNDIGSEEVLIWKKYDAYKEDLRKRLLTDFKNSFSLDDNGVLSATFKRQLDDGRWIDEIQKEAVKGNLLADLTSRKNILKDQKVPIDARVEDLTKQRDLAMRYGQVDYSELANDKFLTEIETLEKTIEDKQKSLMAKQKELKILQDNDSDDANIKKKEKEIKLIQEEIEWNNKLIEDRKLLIAQKNQEKADSVRTPEEKSADATKRLEEMKSKLAATEERIAKAKTEYDAAKGTDKEAIALKKYNDELAKKEKLEQSIKNIKENISRWDKASAKDKTKSSTNVDEKNVGEDAAIRGGLLAALAEHTNIGSEEILNNIADTLLKILNVITSGGVKIDTDSSSAKTVNNADIDKKLARIAILEAEKSAATGAGSKSIKGSGHRDISKTNIYKEIQDSVNKFRNTEVKESKTSIDAVKKALDELSKINDKNSREYIEWQRKLGTALSAYGKKNGVADGKGYYDRIYELLKKKGLNVDPDLAITNPRGLSSALLKSGLVSADGKGKATFSKKKEKELERLRREVGATSSGKAVEDIIPDETAKEVDELTLKIDKLKNKFIEAQKVGYLDPKDTGLNDFEKKLKDIERAVSEGKTPKKLEAMRNEALRLGNVVNDKVGANKRLYSGTAEINAVQKQHSQMAARGILDDDHLVKIKEYNREYDKLIALHKSFSTKGTLYDPKNQEALRQQATQVRDLGKALSQSMAEAERLQQLVDSSGSYNGKSMGKMWNVTPEETSNLEATMRSYLKTMNLGHIENVKFDNIHKKLTGTLRTSKQTVSDLEIKYNDTTKALYAYQKQERESLIGFPAFIKGFKGKINSILQYTMSITSIHRIFAELRRGIQYIREIDLALTELRKVTDETDETYKKFLKTAAQTGERLGSTISSVTEATATFAKLGYTMKQASEMAESAIVYKNVGDNIESTEDAANSIISTLKGFGMEASESMEIVDRFNEVGNRFAITSQGIGEALRLSASALNEGGNSLDESIGLITAANEVVNDPSSVGTALKTLTLRLRGSKTE